MAESENEKSGLGIFVKKQTKYGAIKKEVRINETYLTHTLSKGETLAGIALNYGVNIEQIKRINKLWTNDSLFLRETLKIPIVKGQQTHNISNGDLVTGLDNEREPTDSRTIENTTNDDIIYSGGASNVITDTVTGPEHIQVQLPQDEISPSDFFSKFDSSMSVLKSNIKEQEQRISTLNSEEQNPLSLLPQKKSKFGSRHHLRSISLSTDDDTELLIGAEPSFRPANSGAKSKQVDRKSLERLERTQDDLFQL